MDKKKPFYKKTWFIVLAVILVMGAIGSSMEKDDSSSLKEPVKQEVSSSKEKKQEVKKEKPSKEASKKVAEEKEEITYTPVTADKLIDDLSNNALKAEKNYQDQYLEITGKISNIDSDGSYISIEGTSGKFSVYSIQCFLKNDEQKDFVMNSSKGATVVVKGKITAIGEVLGYQLDVDEIKSK